MVAGLPGSGIGGCFFLLTALLMPFVETVRTLQGRSSLRRWRFVSFQAGIALGVVGTMWATGWAIGWAFYAVARRHVQSGHELVAQPQNFLQAPPIFYTLGVLLSVITAVAVLRWRFARKTNALPTSQ